MPDPIVIFFDGKCNLCDWFVNFVFKRDRQRKFLYSPLQGETARQKLRKEDTQDLKSIVVLKDNMVFRESEAIKIVMTNLYPRYAIMFSFLPPFFFNFFYRIIAKRRYILFGKTDKLYHPSDMQKKFFRT